jgi:hypothetical protein
VKKKVKLIIEAEMSEGGVQWVKEQEPIRVTQVILSGGLDLDLRDGHAMLTVEESK